jgi:hypothetical protein
MLKMVTHERASHAPESFVDRRYLGHDIGAVAVLIDHLLEAAHLSFDAAEPDQISGFDLGIDRNRFSARPIVGGIAGAESKRRFFGCWHFSVFRARSLSVVSDLGDESFIGHRGEDAVGFGSRRIIGHLRGPNRDELDAHAVDPIERFPDGIHTMRARHSSDVQL